MADSKLTAEIGRSGLVQYGGTIREEFLPELSGQQGVRTYAEMRANDPAIATGLRAIGWMVGQLGWSVQPGGETAEDQEAAGFLESAMQDMSVPWGRVVQDALTCLPFGWAYSEVVYKVRNGAKANPPSLYDDGRLGWRKISLVGQSSLDRWELDPDGGIRGLWQMQDTGKSVLIPIEKSLLFRMDAEKNNPEGVSLLRSVYYPWYVRKNLQEIEAIGIERDLTGVPVITLPVGATTDDRTKAIELLEQFKADDMSGFVLPRIAAGEENAWTVALTNSPGSKAIDTGKVIGRYSFEIARNFLLQFLLLGSAEGATGSWALATAQRDLFSTALGAITGMIEDVLNRYLVPVLFRVNDLGQLTALPQIKAGRISRGDLEAFGKSLLSLTQAGLLTPERGLEQYLREQFELPDLPEDLAESQGKPEPEESGQDEQGDQHDQTTQQATEPTEPVHHTGAMVALYPSPQMARALALAGGCDPEELHVTLAFLGEVANLTEVQTSALRLMVADCARQARPIKAAVGGIGRFDGGGDDGDDAVFANVDAPDLPEFRQALTQAIASAGVEHNREHGFTPHMTLAYVAATAPTPLRRLPIRDVRFTSVSLVLGDERTDYPLGNAQQASEPEPTEARDEPAPPIDDVAEARADAILKATHRRRASTWLARRFATPAVSYADDLAALRDKYETRLTDLARQYREGRLPYERWIEATKREIADEVVAGYKLGLAEARGIDPPWRLSLTPAERLQAEKLVKAQYDYFLGFRDDLAKQRQAGEPYTTALDSRAGLYSGATVDAFNTAKLAVEGARRLTWVRHKSDSCATCLGMDGSTKTASEWEAGGIYPAHGTQCGGRCGCSLVEAD